jgi:predicted lipid-binding transport protein (Tim44 family)
VRRRGLPALAAAALAAALAVAVLAGLAGLALARPGGGQTYGGGGGGSGGGGGGGDDIGGLVLLLLELVVRAPQIGIPLTLVVVAIVLAVNHSQREARTTSWDSTAILAPLRPRAIDLEPLRAVDPAFSQVLFEDFLYRLIAQAHLARGQGDLLPLAPYLAAPVREVLRRRPGSGGPLDGVVIGSLRVIGLRFPLHGEAPLVRVTAEVELNVNGPRAAWYLREEWRLRRAAGVASRPPTTARAFLCPSCGAPFSSSDDQTCAYCAQVVDSGRFDWQAEAVVLHDQRSQPPALTGTVAERGTHEATVIHPRMRERWAELQVADPAQTTEAIGARLRLIYDELNAGWNARDLGRLRPWVSDGVFDYLRYWLEGYGRNGLENYLVNAALDRWAVVKVVRDAHYDALTIRLWAHGKDYTVAPINGAVVGGSKSQVRHYSEYWTLIRGATVRGAPRAERRCPSCGAELAIAMAGTCSFCQVHVTAGEFDWVLSKIEQDEAYGG